MKVGRPRKRADYRSKDRPSWYDPRKVTISYYIPQEFLGWIKSKAPVDQSQGLGPDAPRHVGSEIASAVTTLA
jgi:hypothetical protein